jgi:hypothetical protein
VAEYERDGVYAERLEIVECRVARLVPVNLLRDVPLQILGEASCDEISRGEGARADESCLHQGDHSNRDAGAERQILRTKLARTGMFQ